MGAILDKLKAAAKARKETISQSNLDDGDKKKYNIQSLTDANYLLDKLPKGSLLGGAIDEEGNINVETLEKSLQRVVFSAIQASAKESHNAIEALRGEFNDSIQTATRDTSLKNEERDLVFFPHDDTANKLAIYEYEKLKEEYKDTNPSVADLKAATLENLKDIQTTAPKPEVAEDVVEAPDFSDLLGNIPEESQEAEVTTNQEAGAEAPSAEE